jgi:3-oxoacyl-[acyl-carrier-protein] synthase-3
VIGTKILGFGGYQPDKVVTNDDLAKIVDTNDEWIRSRVGIQSRRVARDDETVADMAEAAGAKALAATGLEPSEVDLVIVATCSPESPLPNVAATVAHRLGIPAPGAYDLNAACAGFCYAVGAASDAVKVGSARNVLVIGAEKMTSWIDWNDRSTCIIFADGAGAAVVGPSGTDEPAGIGPVVWGSAGGQAEKIIIEGRNGTLKQDGQAVFRWATTAMAPVALEACRRAGVTPADITAFVPHQANLRIVEAIARKLGIPRERVADDIIHAGNTSSASIPLALSRMAEQGRLQPGTPALLIARRRAGLRLAGDHGTLAAPCPDVPYSLPRRRGNGSPTTRGEIMTDQEILSGLAEIIEEIAGTPANEVTPEANFVDDLDIDSLSMVEIAVAAQDKFGVEIPDEQLKDLKTVQDVVNFVSKNS